MKVEVLERESELTDAELELVTGGGLLRDVAKGVFEGLCQTNPLTATGLALGKVAKQHAAQSAGLL